MTLDELLAACDRTIAGPYTVTLQRARGASGWAWDLAVTMRPIASRETVICASNTVLGAAIRSVHTSLTRKESRAHDQD